ncbi:MAG TPA: M48 family metallopeptidase, partial [Candidatus Binatia bacterium]|nr:M48 family metallopeptidase [Candidatus Binatia bacterium]
MRSLRTIAVLILAGVTTGCVVEAGSSRTPAPQQTPRSSASRPLDARQTERVQRVMMPLLRAANNPRRLNEIRVRVIDDPKINAANAGGGEFQITTGLLAKANDEHLRGVLAHEIAHDDLGHVARAQTLGTGLNIGVILLEQLFPGSSAVTPIAGALIANSYSRSEELEADRHGVEILRRAGYSKEVMIGTLTWLLQTSGGDSGGGFLSTHPGIEDRIDALKKLA